MRPGLPVHNTFVPQKVPLSKISDDVIAFILGPLDQKSWLRQWHKLQLLCAYCCSSVSRLSLSLKKSNFYLRLVNKMTFVVAEQKKKTDFQTPLVETLRKFTPKYKRLNMFWTSPESKKRGLRVDNLIPANNTLSLQFYSSNGFKNKKRM